MLVLTLPPRSAIKGTRSRTIPRQLSNVMFHIGKENDQPGLGTSILMPTNQTFLTQRGVDNIYQTHYQRHQCLSVHAIRLADIPRYVLHCYSLISYSSGVPSKSPSNSQVRAPHRLVAKPPCPSRGKRVPGPRASA